jgi:hypothetical protein
MLNWVIYGNGLAPRCWDTGGDAWGARRSDQDRAGGAPPRYVLAELTEADSVEELCPPSSLEGQDGAVGVLRVPNKLSTSGVRGLNAAATGTATALHPFWWNGFFWHCAPFPSVT